MSNFWVIVAYDWFLGYWCFFFSHYPWTYVDSMADVKKLIHLDKYFFPYLWMPVTLEQEYSYYFYQYLYNF